MSTLSDFGSCETCQSLPDGFPCSDCYIKRGKEFGD